MIDTDENKVFCMAPWKHVHAWANGAVYPCCLSNGEEQFQFGNINEKSLSELFNSPTIRQMRLDLLQGKKHGACTRCYEQEELGFRSMRQSFNDEYYDQTAIDSTEQDGTVKDIQLAYWDIRFSNVCNMKCRTCGPDFSTLWHTDTKLLGNEFPKIKKIRSDLIQEVKPYIKDIDQVYFAGGEPLIMEEHWDFVDQLVKHGNKNIRFFYQTNLSQLTFKDKSAIDLWNKFENVTVTASLDAHGKLANYVRNGTDWDKIEKNIRLIREHCPHVIFKVSCTTSLLNVHNVVEFYEYLTKNDLLGRNNFEINPVMYPYYYKIDLLPKPLLKKYRNNIKEHIDRLRTVNENVDNTLSNFNSLLSMLNTTSKFGSHEWNEFLHITKSLDSIRNENVKEYLKDLAIYDLRL